MSKIKTLIMFSLFLVGATLFSTPAGAETHTVKEDETLYTIAERYDITVETLLELNEIESAKEVTEGFIVRLPDHITNTALYKKEEIHGLEVVKTLTVSASAYTANCNGCTGVTKTGINLKKNPDAKVIAVDPNVIKLGTKVWVEGYGVAVAGDIGGAIKGNKIDVFMKSRDVAFEWGRKNVTIKILK